MPPYLYFRCDVSLVRSLFSGFLHKIYGMISYDSDLLGTCVGLAAEESKNWHIYCEFFSSVASGVKGPAERKLARFRVRYRMPTKVFDMTLTRHE